MKNPMYPDETKELFRLAQLINQVLPVKIPLEMSCNDWRERNLLELGLDSLNTVDLVLLLEKEYGILIPDEKLLVSNFMTLDKIMNTVSEQCHSL